MFQMFTHTMRMTWFWTRSWRSISLTLVLIWWPWRRWVINSALFKNYIYIFFYQWSVSVWVGFQKEVFRLDWVLRKASDFSPSLLFPLCLCLCTLQTEHTMTELEIAVNQRVGEWEVIQESGTTLRPLWGPGLTGMKNLGNSCYLNSVMQVLFTIPDFQEKSVPLSLRVSISFAVSQPFYSDVCKTFLSTVSGWNGCKYKLNESRGSELWELNHLLQQLMCSAVKSKWWRSLFVRLCCQSVGAVTRVSVLLKIWSRLCRLSFLNSPNVGKKTVVANSATLEICVKYTHIFYFYCKTKSIAQTFRLFFPPLNSFFFFFLLRRHHCQ